MPCLGDFDCVRNKLSSSGRAVVVVLHKFVYETEGDRGNRQRLRQFEGFDDNKEKYDKKEKYVKENLTVGDLVSVCNLLDLNYDTDNLFSHIYTNLLKGQLLCSRNLEEDDNDDNDDDDDVSYDDAENTMMQHNLQQGLSRENVTKINKKTSDSSLNVNRNLIGNVHEHNDDYMRQTTQRNVSYNTTKFAMSFRDIEDSIRNFDGTNSLPINTWIEEFEETAAVMGWDEFQKYVFAKKSLKGVAKLFISSEKGITTYERLKYALCDEFETCTSSIQIHKMLCERKMKKDESVHEYYLNMKELSARSNIDYNSLMQYVIDGINDNEVNKMILYGAKNSKEFKDKLRCYETMNKSYYKRKVEPKKIDKDSTKDFVKDKGFDLKCFNCGDKGHKSIDCEYKQKGTKCFECNTYGHIAKNCSVKKEISNDKNLKNEPNMRVLIPKPKLMNKNVKIGNFNCISFFDTGSKYNIITDNVYKNLNKPKINDEKINLFGFGQGNEDNIKSIGSLKYDIEIDNELYNVSFLVVSSEHMYNDVVLGEEFCKVANVTINRDGVHFEKIQQKEFDVNTTLLETAVTSKILVVDEQDSEECKSNCETSLKENLKPKMKQFKITAEDIMKLQDAVEDYAEIMVILQDEQDDKDYLLKADNDLNPKIDETRAYNLQKPIKLCDDSTTSTNVIGKNQKSKHALNDGPYRGAKFKPTDVEVLSQSSEAKFIEPWLFKKGRVFEANTPQDGRIVGVDNTDIAENLKTNQLIERRD